tara:strand:- start:481 stop:1323 length:843 start_codon:yes stop_codon:yes gene_type:complete
MAWTTPRTWVSGELVTAALFNTHLRDNLNALDGGRLAIASQAAGDVVYASSSTAIARLAKDAGKYLKSGASAVSWATLGGSHTTQVFTSGSGTYTTPTGCAAIRVRMVGGGGGSGAAATNNGTAGGNTTFSASSMQANGGGLGTNGASSGGTGGTGGTGANGLINAKGNDGGSGGDDTAAAGGTGGGSYFVGGGRSGTHGGGAGLAAGAYGGGGGAPGSTAGLSNSPGGGGGGGYCERLISSPDATYTYAVGAAGSGGAAGTTAGQNGSAGLIIVEEWYI